MPRRQTVSELELLVLFALMRLEDDVYGVPIGREIAATAKRAVPLGSIYAALDRLMEKGFVTSRLGEATPERGGRARKYFHITGKGLRAAREARESLLGMWQGIPAFEGARV